MVRLPDLQRRNSRTAKVLDRSQGRDHDLGMLRHGRRHGRERLVGPRHRSVVERGRRVVLLLLVLVPHGRNVMAAVAARSVRDIFGGRLGRTRAVRTRPGRRRGRGSRHAALIVHGRRSPHDGVAVVPPALHVGHRNFQGVHVVDARERSRGPHEVERPLRGGDLLRDGEDGVPFDGGVGDPGEQISHLDEPRPLGGPLGDQVVDVHAGLEQVRLLQVDPEHSPAQEHDVLVRLELVEQVPHVLRVRRPQDPGRLVGGGGGGGGGIAVGVVAIGRRRSRFGAPSEQPRCPGARGRRIAPTDEVEPPAAAIPGRVGRRGGVPSPKVSGLDRIHHRRGGPLEGRELSGGVRAHVRRRVGRRAHVRTRLVVRIFLVVVVVVVILVLGRARGRPPVRPSVQDGAAAGKRVVRPLMVLFLLLVVSICRGTIEWISSRGGGCRILRADLVARTTTSSSSTTTIMSIRNLVVGVLVKVVVVVVVVAGRQGCLLELGHLNEGRLLVAASSTSSFFSGRRRRSGGSRCCYDGPKEGAEPGQDRRRQEGWGRSGGLALLILLLLILLRRLPPLLPRLLRLGGGGVDRLLPEPPQRRGGGGGGGSRGRGRRGISTVGSRTGSRRRRSKQ
jgi:hypothetical protein